MWDNTEALLQAKSDYAVYYTSTKSEKVYSDVQYPDDVLLLFGKETKGLPESLLLAHPERMIRIPMYEEARSLNLANSVAIVLYEYLRQKDFPGLLCEGKLNGLE